MKQCFNGVKAKPRLCVKEATSDLSYEVGLGCFLENYKRKRRNVVFRKLLSVVLYLSQKPRFLLSIKVAYLHPLSKSRIFQKVYLSHFQSSSHLRDKHCSNIFHDRLISFAYPRTSYEWNDVDKNSVQFLLLSIIFIRFICFVASCSTCYLFIAKQYCILLIYFSLFIHFPVDGLLVFQFWSIMKVATMNFFV